MKLFILAAAGVAALTIKAKTSPIDKIQAEVRRESVQNIQLHDLYKNMEAQDAEDEKKIKANRNLIMLQTSPLDKVAQEVGFDTHENIHISDSFGDEEKKDIAKEKEIKSDKNLHALLQTQKTSPAELDKQINAERHSAVHISDRFSEEEKADKKKEHKINADKSLQAMLQKKEDPFDIEKMGSKSEDDDSSAGTAMDKYMAEFKSTHDDHIKPDDYSQQIAHSSNGDGAVISIPLSSQLQTQVSLLQTKTKTAPNTDQEVQRERKWDVYLADAYSKMEKKDVLEEREIRADPTMKA